MRVPVPESVETDPPQPFPAPLRRLASRHAAKLEPRDESCAERVTPWHEALSLEPIAGAPVETGERLAEHRDGTGGGLQQPGREVEESRFSAAGRTDDRDELTGAHVERGVPDRRVALGPILARNVGAGDVR